MCRATISTGRDYPAPVAARSNLRRRQGRLRGALDRRRRGADALHPPRLRDAPRRTPSRTPQGPEGSAATSTPSTAMDEIGSSRTNSSRSGSVVAFTLRARAHQGIETSRAGVCELSGDQATGSASLPSSTGDGLPRRRRLPRSAEPRDPAHHRRRRGSAPLVSGAAALLRRPDPGLAAGHAAPASCAGVVGGDLEVPRSSELTRLLAAANPRRRGCRSPKTNSLPSPHRASPRFPPVDSSSRSGSSGSAGRPSHPRDLRRVPNSARRAWAAASTSTVGVDPDRSAADGRRARRHVVGASSRMTIRAIRAASSSRAPGRPRAGSSTPPSRRSARLHDRRRRSVRGPPSIDEVGAVEDRGGHLVDARRRRLSAEIRRGLKQRRGDARERPADQAQAQPPGSSRQASG